MRTQYKVLTVLCLQETVSMTEELRMRLRYLRHLPVTCNFDVVEVTLRSPVVSKATVAMFQVILNMLSPWIYSLFCQLSFGYVEIAACDQIK